MPRDSSGAYTLPVNSCYPAQADTNLSSYDNNALLADVAAAITNSVLPIFRTWMPTASAPR
ncbi:MAG: hypothetical protein ACYDD1_03550 [Caulobacteraceae bacterium]